MPTPPSQATPQPSKAEASGPELPKQYRPSEHEQGVWDGWIASAAFRADPARVLSGQARPYSLLIPPPNVTAALHLGHALNNTLQDILARAHRMQGFETLWMPGTDHAGIATQAVVEKRLRKEGKLKGALRHAYTRDAFVAEIQAFKDEYEAVITGQLKAMGCSCDWDRQRFTMDPICARAVREAFFRLFKDGLIYRGKRLVNWDPALQTAVADDECYEEEVDTSFWYLKYPLESPATLPDGSTIDHVTVATTRPETFLGDTAVAINPKDPRAAALVGRHVVLPLVNRRIPIVADSYAVLPEAMATTDEEKNDPKARFSTGFVKITPAHDANDYALWQRHLDAIPLGALNMMSPDGRVSNKHGWTDTGDAAAFVGLTMSEARKKIVAEFKARGLLAETKPYRQNKTFSDRSKAEIEPYLSDQWYVRVTDPRLAQAANAALVPEQRTPSGAGFQPAAHPPCSHSGAGFQPAAHPPCSHSGAGFQPAAHSAPEPGFDEGSPPSLIIRSRRLPHWELGGRSYFITFRTARGDLSPTERELVLSACRHFDGKRYELHAVVVMPDHVHLILTPFRVSATTWRPLPEILHSIKSFTATAISKERGTPGPVWQDESFDRLLRENGELQEKLAYIQANPVQARLAPSWREYAFAWIPEETLQGRVRFPDHWRPQEDGGLEARPTEENRSSSGTSSTGSTLRFFPARYAKTFEGWHDNIRDWCISRQLWWGHRIPVWRKRIHLTESNWIDELGNLGLDSIINPGRTVLGIMNVADSSTLTRTPIAATDYAAVAFVRTQTGEMHDLSRDGLSPVTADTAGEYDVFVSVRDDGFAKHLESAGFSQDPDVLDTWFSSALWPLSTLGWPDTAQASADDPRAGGDFDALLRAFNPTTSLSTAREIITLWVSRMTMFNRYFRGQDLALGAGNGPAPFRDVFIHAVIQDGEGRKMSKSLGNGVDPLDIIATHGSDAMRFTLATMATNTQDVRLPVRKDPATGKNTSEKFDLGRNFATKLWNAARFALEKLDAPQNSSATTPVTPTSLPDRWMLSRLGRAIAECNAALANYEFSVYANTCYTLLWNDFCDWYLEAVKPTIAADASQRAVLRATLDAILRLLHPVMPYVTEVLYGALSRLPAPAVAGLQLSPPPAGMLVRAGWPVTSPALLNPDAEASFTRVQALVSAVREVRAQLQVPFKRAITLHMPDAATAALGPGLGLVTALANIGAVTASAPTGPSTPITIEGSEFRLSNLADQIDAGAEKDRLTRLVADLSKSRTTLEGRLANPGYAQKAPPHMVQQTKDQLAKAEAELAAASAALEALG